MFSRCPKFRSPSALIWGLWLIGMSLRVFGAVENPWLIETWNTEKGLPNDTVTAIAQTREGFLWAGTDNGLARFDGQQFRIFQPQNTPALASGRVRALCADDTGALWVLPVEPQIIRWSAGAFEIVRAGAGMESAKIVSLAANGGVLWYATEKGASGKLEGDTLCPVTTNKFALDGSLRLFSGTNGVVYATSSRRVDQLSSAGTKSLFAMPSPLRFAVPGRAGWWLATQSSLTLRKGGKIIATANVPMNIIRTIKAALEDRDGNLWLGTEQNGVYCRMNDGTIQQFSSAEGLGGDAVLCLFQDQEGAIWVGSQRGGLSRLRRRIFHAATAKGVLAREAVTAVCEGQPGELWVGTERNGLSKLVNGEAKAVGTVEGRLLKRVCSLEFDSTERLWVGTQERGLFQVKGGHVEPFRALMEVPQVAAIFEDDRWGLWIGGGTSKALLRIVGDAVQSFTVPPAIPGLDVRVFANDGGGGLWFGSQGSGLFHWDGIDYRRYTRAEGLGSDTIWSLRLDPTEQCLWVGTAGGGLSRLKEEKILTCTKRNGLYDDVVCQILEDGKGWLWCSSPRGIFRVSKGQLQAFFDGKSATVHSVVYGLGDGLPSLECAGSSQPAGCRSHDGRLWWPTAKGLVWVDPDEVRTNPEAPKVILDRILVDDQPVSFREKSVSDRGKGMIPLAVVGPGARRVEFDFTALSWSAPELVAFRYRLEGFDRDWVEAGGARAAFYNGLPPRQYRFQVIAANRDGNWNSIGSVVALRLQPYFWQTWWFELAWACALAVSVGLGVAWVLRRRHRARVERLEMQNAVEKERTRIAKNIHDDVGASLTQIALMSERLEGELHSVQAKPQLERISSKARSVVRALNETVWAVNPGNDNLVKLIDHLCAVSEELCELARVRCFHDVPVGLPERPVQVDFRHNLFLAVKEALHNAIKHAAASEIWLRVDFDGKSLRITIEDNGRGFDSASARSLGNGLKNMKTRVADLGGRAEISSKPAAGTKIVFIAPLP